MKRASVRSRPTSSGLLTQVIGVPEVGKGDNNNNRNNGQEFNENYKLTALRHSAKSNIRNMKKTEVPHNEIALIEIPVIKRKF